MPKRTDIQSILIIGAASIVALVGCVAPARAQANSVVNADTAELYREAGLARWSIVLHSGRGIPGSPGAEDYIRDAFGVAQRLVTTCRLGRTIYALATDGVSILAIKNRNLTPAQLACIRAAERPGLRLRDAGPQN
jgi:hypothetical protein